MPSSSDERRDALIRISQFVLRGETEEIRQELQENVVEMALFLLDPQQGTSPEAIMRVLKEKILVEFPRPILKAILARLAESGRVDRTCRLSLQRRMEIETKTRTYAKGLDEIADQLAARTEKRFGLVLTQEQKGVIMEALFRFLSALFVRRADICAKLITSSEVGETALEAPLATLDKSLENIGDLRLRDAARGAIMDILQNPNDVVARFLLHLNENLVCIEVLNLDPECQTLEKEAFAKKNLLLDTNIIISLLCSRSRQYRLSRELVALSKQVGANLLVTERTLKEFNKVLEDANTRFQSFRAPIRLNLLRAVDDDFIASFAVEKETNRHEQWEGYYLRMQRVAGILKNNYGIELFEKDYPEIYERPFFSEIAGQVSDCYEKARNKPKKKDVAEHDAYHIILVRQLSREAGPSMLGPSHWFLSHDQTLPCIEPLLREKTHDGKAISTMVSDIWLQMIEPFLSRDLREKQAVQAFTELLGSQFGTIPFRIDSSVLAELQGDWLNYEWLEAEDLEKILGEKFVSDYVSKVREMRKLGEDTTEVSGKLRQQLEIRLNALVNEKIQSLGNEVKSLREQIQAKTNAEDGLRAELINEKKFSRRWRTLSGLAGLVMIFSNLLFIGTKTLEFNAFTTAYFAGTFLVGAILVLIAVAPENVIARLEAALRLQGSAPTS